MRKTFYVASCFVLTLLAVLPAAAQKDISGLWDAVVVVNRLEIPFRYEIAVRGDLAEGFFFEGNSKAGSTSGSFRNGNLRIDYDHLNATLEARIEGDQLRGAFRSKWPKAAPLEFRARRFAPVPSGTATPPQIAGDWTMRRVAAEQKAPRDSRSWSLFLRQSGAEVSGSILRVDGDTGTLSGHWQNGKLVLSHFAGERPLLFEAQLKPDGTLAIALDRAENYVAARSKEARAKGIPEPPDPSRYTSVKDPTQRFHFNFPGMDGKKVADTDARFKGKVVVLAIGGSWCPNCQDEAPFLVELYNKFHSRGLEIVGLSFEADADPALAHPRMQSFIRRYGIPYPMLLVGDLSEVNAKLPQIVNFGAFPTSIYLGRDGRVKSVHAGFASAATGEEHVRLKRELTEVVERLLAEEAPKTAASF